MSDAVAHYDAAYFAWQQEIGLFAGRANAFKFEPYIRPTDRVLDFGCGGGYLLRDLVCADRVGIEVNPEARAEAALHGIRTVTDPTAVPDAWADVIISNSALEHVEAPLSVLRSLYPKLRPGGTIVVVVPHETMQAPWQPGDINQHLYTWSCTTLGNMLSVAGFQVQSVAPSKLVWPPRIYRRIAAVTGHAGLRLASRAYRALRVGLSPVWPLDIDGAVIGVGTRSI